MFVILTFNQFGSHCAIRPDDTHKLIRSIIVVRTSKTRQSGFTLIEIMVVVIILGILAAIVAPNVIGRIDDAQITRVQQDLRGVENALKFYRLDNFAYPTSEQGLQALVTKPNDPNIRNWKGGGYLDRLPKDPWGKEYQYLSPGQNGEIDIYTFGRDGRPGGEGIDADIGNWELE